MIVIDTSVAFKWFSLEEQSRNHAKHILTEHIKNQTQIIVPDLFFYEIANAWATKVMLSIENIYTFLAKLESYQLVVAPLTFPLLSKITAFSKTFRVSVYDASYAVLASEKGCKLITADEKFVKQVQLPYVTLLQ